MRTLLTLVFIASSYSQAPAASAVDPQGSDVRFTVTKFGFSDVAGVFRSFSADVRYDPDRPENSSVRWRVRVASVETGERGRDSALQSAEYFDARRHPELLFESRSLRVTGDRALQVTGDLTIRGVTKRITIPVTVTQRDGRRAFATDFELDRYDFNVRGGTVMGRLIGRTVRVQLVAVEGVTNTSAPQTREQLLEVGR